MKKMFLAVVAITTLVIYSCSSDKEEIQMNDSEFMIKSNWNNIKSSTNLTSKVFYNLGIKNILVSNVGTALNYKFITFKKANFDGYTFDFSTKEFIVDNNIIYEKNNTGYALKYDNGNFLIKTPSMPQFSSVPQNLGSDVNVGILFAFTNELTLTPGHTFPIVDHENEAASSGEGCAPENIAYVIGSGATPQAASATLTYMENNGSYDMSTATYVNGFQCRKLGGNYNYSFLGLWYYSKSTWCCTGGGAGGSW